MMRALVYLLKVVVFVFLYHLSFAVLAGPVLFLGEPGAIDATRQAALLGAAMWGIFLLLGVIIGYAAHRFAGGGAITGALVGTAYTLSIEVPFYFARMAAGDEPSFGPGETLLRTASGAVISITIICACAAGGLLASTLARRRAMAQEADAREPDDNQGETLPPPASSIQSVD